MKDFWLSMLPPVPGDEAAEARWNWTVWVKLWLLMFFAAWALDTIPGFPGFARADDVKYNAEMIMDLRIENTSNRIFELRIKECDPTTPTQLRQTYARQRQGLMDTYYHLTGHRYELMTCDEVR